MWSAVKSYFSGKHASNTNVAPQITTPARITPIHDPEFVKALMLGGIGVGKTTFFNMFTEGHNITRMCTISVDFKYRHIPMDGGDALRLQLWDTAGQERFRYISKTYYKEAHLVVLMYDISDKKTLEDAKLFIKNVRDDEANPHILFTLIGNKLDLEPRRQVSTREGFELSKQLDIPLFFEISAKKDLDQVAHAMNTSLRALWELRKYKYSFNQINSLYGTYKWQDSAPMFKTQLMKRVSNRIYCDIVIN